MKQLLTLIMMAVFLLGCVPTNAAVPASNEVNTATQEGTGTLEIRANGEDFVRQGFVSKDGWRIDFDHVYVTLVDIQAYQVDPPYDASEGADIDGVANGLDGTVTIDLAEGDENADPILAGTINDAPVGQFNALAWRMVNATEGDSAGYTVWLDGKAEKEGQQITFTLKVEDEYAYTCGEYVGDARKGFLSAEGSTDVEATFHFDHVFGDADSPLDDGLNVGALGFDPLAAVAEGSELETDMASLAEKLSGEDMATLRDTLSTLGHVGEGHCYEATGGFTGHGME